MIYEKPKKLDAIHALDPNSVSIIRDGVIEWIRNDSNITESQIDTKLASMISDWEVQAYARNRRAEYPRQGDQNDMIYKDNKNSTTTHADAVEAVKTKWPKDNSGPVE